MLPEQKEKLKGTIGLLDQAIAPLTNCARILGPLIEAEVHEVETLEDADSGDNLIRREKALGMRDAVSAIQTALEVLTSIKVDLEAF